MEKQIKTSRKNHNKDSRNIPNVGNNWRNTRNKA